MRIAFFSTKSYDREFFERYNDNPDIDITFYEARLKQSTVNLTAGFEAVCVFVNDKINASVIGGLKENGVGLIALKSAGFNNVDLEATDKAGIHEKEATEIYDPSGKRYLFLRWDNRFSERDTPGGRSDGLFRTGCHNNIIEMFYYHGNKSSRFNFNFRGNFLILESDSSEKEKVKLKFRRIDYFPT